MKLQEMTWKEAECYFKDHKTAVIPLGSTENHGSHLALGTDFLVPTKLCDYVEENCDVLITPVVPFGIADQHVNFPGTITLGYDGLYLVMNQIVTQLYGYGIRRFVFLNGHGGNNPVLNRICQELSQKDALGTMVNWWVIVGDLNPAWRGGHGGAVETAAMMAIDEEKYVKMEYYMPSTPTEISEALPAAGMSGVCYKGVTMPVPRMMDQVTASGWSGPDDPKTATAEWGKEMLDAVGAFISEYINEFAKTRKE